jgi:predicted SprT family Zn-dependent metalloprotease
MVANVTFHDDTLREMATWAARRYKLGRVDVLFSDRVPGKGYQHRSGVSYFQRGHACIELNTHRTISTLVQVLAHELAHCVALKRYRYAGHGRKFVKIGNELVHGWNAKQQQERGAI